MHRTLLRDLEEPAALLVAQRTAEDQLPLDLIELAFLRLAVRAVGGMDARVAETDGDAVEPDPADPNHATLEDNLARLRAARDADGRRLRVVPLPMPEPIEEGNPVKGHEAVRAPASYANFYIANGLVLVPVFRQKRRDAEALRILRGLFPRRRVVGIDCRAVVGGNGAIHCVTQQQPRFAAGTST